MKFQYFLLIIFTAFTFGCKNIGRQPDNPTVNDTLSATEVQPHPDIDSSLIHDTSRPDGVYEDKNANGIVTERGEIRNGVQDGKRYTYFADGKPRTEENFVNGSYEGTFKEFHQNGKLFQEGHYSHNAMNGIWKTYYDTGELKEEVTMVANNENGPFKEYHKNGKIKYEGTYKDGDHEDGEMKVYNEEGELIKKLDCKMGECNTIWVKKAYEDFKR